MRYDEIQKKLKQQPFAPFDIVVSSGDRYRLQHPDVAMITKHGVIVAKVDPRQKPGAAPFEDYAACRTCTLRRLIPSVRHAVLLEK